MNTFLLDYIPIIIFLGIAIGMASLIMIASWIVAKQNPDEEKLSPYECGFDAFEDTRSQFDVRFYLVAILFIIFDPTIKSASASSIPLIFELKMYPALPCSPISAPSILQSIFSTLSF